MIRIGNAFFDDDFYWGIVPCGNYDTDRYVVALRSGEKLNIAAEPAEIVEALSAAGHISGDASEPGCEETVPPVGLLEAESAARSGCRFIATDARGFCYAFINEPVRQGAYWIDPDGAPAIRLYDLELPDDGPKLIEEYLKRLQN